MKKWILYLSLALVSMLVASTAAVAGAKHMGAGIALPSEHLVESPWLMVGAATFVGIVALRILRSVRG